MRTEIRKIILVMENYDRRSDFHASQSSMATDHDSAVSLPLRGAGTDGTRRNGRAIRSLYPAS